MFKYSVILNNVGSCCDRFLPSGYGETFSNEQLFERLSTIENVSGTELISGSSITKDNVRIIEELLKKYNFKVSSIIPNHFGDAKWKNGAFTSCDSNIRKQAIEETFEMIDIAKRLGCKTINIWNGQDGHDYPLQMDYSKCNDWLVDGIKKSAEYGKEKGIDLSIEYKPKEPRNYSIVSNMFSTLRIIDKVGMDNVGVTIDTGHSFEAYENIAESAVAAMKEGKLFHMHFNDNYRHWDDDMIVGSIHTIEYIELLYWLKRMKYTGWLSMDQYPYREDSVKAVEQSIKWLKAFENKADKIDMDKMAYILSKQDAVLSTEYVRELIFG